MKNTKKKRTAIIFTLCATIIGWLIMVLGDGGNGPFIYMVILWQHSCCGNMRHE